MLAGYEEHGRLRGGTAEEAAEQAYRGWLADYLAGLDTVLVARTEDQARELSRRARDDLIRYGRVADGPQVRLVAGESASAGDLVTARRTNRQIPAGQNGRDLANRDILLITATPAGHGGDRVAVRRLLDRDPATGQARWSAPFGVPQRYLAAHSSLAYATTAHAALGRTTDTAHVLVDGLAGRQGLNVAMSRGREANYAYCITQSPGLADVAAGSGRAPELDRAIGLDRERAGLPPEASRPPRTRDGDTGPVLDPVTVMAQVMARDGSELSATETLERELARADDLGVLGAIWDDLVRREQHARFGQALRAALGGDLAEQALDDPALTWLWRTLREAEAAGLDGCQGLHQAVAARTMTGARDVARVIDSRARRMLRGARPQPPGCWAGRVPGTGPQELRDFLRELAAAMDDRTRRLGEHAAQTQPLWARQALGPLPGDPAARLDWEQRAGVIAAYRERYRYGHPADPIGPEPAQASPEARATWHGALAAAARIDGIGLRHCTDGDLWLRRGTYERETARAPPRVTPELQLARTAARDAHVHAVRAEHEAASARDPQAAIRHRELARRWRTVETKAGTELRLLTQVQETRRNWEQVTDATRRIAVAADLELRRRHPGRPVAALRPHHAEAAARRWWEPATEAGSNGEWMQDTLDGPAARRKTGNRHRPEQQPVPARRPQPNGLAVLGLTPETADMQVPAQLLRTWRDAQATQRELDELVSLRLPAEEPDLEPGQAWPEQARRQRAAILQPSQPEIRPAQEVLESFQAANAGPGRTESEREAG